MIFDIMKIIGESRIKQVLHITALKDANKSYKVKCMQVSVHINYVNISRLDDNFNHSNIK